MTQGFPSERHQRFNEPYFLLVINLPGVRMDQEFGNNFRGDAEAGVEGVCNRPGGVPHVAPLFGERELLK